MENMISDRILLLKLHSKYLVQNNTHKKKNIYKHI